MSFSLNQTIDLIISILFFKNSIFRSEEMKKPKKSRDLKMEIQKGIDHLTDDAEGLQGHLSACGYRGGE